MDTVFPNDRPRSLRARYAIYSWRFCAVGVAVALIQGNLVLAGAMLGRTALHSRDYGRSVLDWVSTSVLVLFAVWGLLPDEPYFVANLCYLILLQWRRPVLFLLTRAMVNASQWAVVTQITLALVELVAVFFLYPTLGLAGNLLFLASLSHPLLVAPLPLVASLANVTAPLNSTAG